MSRRSGSVRSMVRWSKAYFPVVGGKAIEGAALAWCKKSDRRLRSINAVAEDASALRRRLEPTISPSRDLTQLRELDSTQQQTFEDTATRDEKCRIKARALHIDPLRMRAEAESAPAIRQARKLKRLYTF